MRTGGQLPSQLGLVTVVCIAWLSSKHPHIWSQSLWRTGRATWLKFLHAGPLLLLVQGATLQPCSPQATRDPHSKVSVSKEKSCSLVWIPTLPTRTCSHRFPGELLPTLMAIAIPAIIPPPPTGATTAFISGACAERKCGYSCTPLCCAPAYEEYGLVSCTVVPSPAPAPPARLCLARRSLLAPDWDAPGLLLSPGPPELLSQLWTKAKHRCHLLIWQGHALASLPHALPRHWARMAPVWHHSCGWHLAYSVGLCGAPRCRQGSLCDERGGKANSERAALLLCHTGVKERDSPAYLQP